MYALRDLTGHCYVHFAFLFTLSEWCELVACLSIYYVLVACLSIYSSEWRVIVFCCDAFRVI